MRALSSVEIECLVSGLYSSDDGGHIDDTSPEDIVACEALVRRGLLRCVECTDGVIVWDEWLTTDRGRLALRVYQAATSRLVA